MNLVFADTSYFVSYLAVSDGQHELAGDLFDDFRGVIHTTDWVFLELANYFSRFRIRTEIAAFVAQLRVDSRFLVAPLTQQMFGAGLSLYDNRPDKHWSLTDCISFVVMADNNITDAWTTDHHFEQAGFSVLMK